MSKLRQGADDVADTGAGSNGDANLGQDGGKSTQERASICAADPSHQDTMTFPIDGNCGSNNCAPKMARDLVDRIKSCLNQDITLAGGHDVLQRTNNSPWRSGRDSRSRDMSASHGDFEAHSLTLVCRIFGFEKYVSSTARDHADNRGDERLNWTSAGDNTSLRFKDDVTFESLISDTPLPQSTYLTNQNRSNGSTSNSYYQTWLQTITCSGKIN